jgi:hypothetical protein
MRTLTWTVEPTAPPSAVRHCPRCEKKQRFTSTDKFRMNAHQSRVDVWLIFQCSVCKFTWKLTVHTRVLPSSIDPERFDAYTQNDRETAWRVGFDANLLQRSGAEPEIPEVEVHGEPLESGGAAEVVLRCPYPVGVRPIAVLSKKLGLSRSRIDQLIERGAIKPSLPKKLTRDLVLAIDLGASDDQPTDGRE